MNRQQNEAKIVELNDSEEPAAATADPTTKKKNKKKSKRKNKGLAAFMDGDEMEEFNKAQ